MAMAAAVAIGAANGCRDAPNLFPCLFRRNGFDKNNSFTGAAYVSLSHPFDDMISDVNRIKCHRCLHFFRASPHFRVT
jgi:hypothetical protein